MSNRTSITAQLKTDLGNVTTANGYNNNFENIFRWKTYPLSDDVTFAVSIKDGINVHSLEEGYRETLSIEIRAMFVIPSSTVNAEEEAYYAKAASVIEDIIKCLYDNEGTYKTLLSEGAFMFQVQNDEIVIEPDGDSALVGEAVVMVNAIHKIKEVWEIDS